jgi:hypothetical protein
LSSASASPGANIDGGLVLEVTAVDEGAGAVVVVSCTVGSEVVELADSSDAQPLSARTASEAPASVTSRNFSGMSVFSCLLVGCGKLFFTKQLV